MPFDDDGFTPRTSAEIIRDYEEKAKNIFDVVNFSVSCVLWQQMKIHAIDEYFYETMMETATSQMSIRNAIGTWLDKHGIETGIFRKGSTHAQGYIDVTADINGSNIAIAAGAEFASSLNVYRTDENNIIEFKIPMTKLATGESYDYFSIDYPYAENVVAVFDESNRLIPASVYQFDTVYNNNIHWLAASSGYIQINETYFVQVQGDVTKRLEVTSVDSGVESNAKIGEIKTSITYPFLTVDNSRGVSGGIDQESDDKYRARLLAAQRRNFTLDKVADIADGIQGVRAVKVYQDKGVDQTSVADWEHPIGIGTVRIDTYYPRWSQAFVPGDLVLSLGRVTLKGRAVNSPPDIKIGVRLANNPTGVYLPDSMGIVGEIELDPVLTGYQDINFDLKYNGLDKTKTYRIDVWCHPSEDGITGVDFSTNYWEIRTVTEGYGTGSRYELYHESGGIWTGQGDSLDLMFKTWYNGAAYTVILATEDGFGFLNLKEELEGMLDYVDGGGLSPIGIQYTIQEATEIDIDVRGIIYIDPLADFTTIREDIISNIETYLESLQTGEKVIYAEIEHQIMRHPSVTNQKNIYIKRSDVSVWGQEDINMLDYEIPDLGTRNFQRGIE